MNGVASRFIKSSERREDFVKNELHKISPGKKILDAGAGEQIYRKYCSHLDYVSQDFCEYTGEGDGKALQLGQWDVSKIDIVSDITDIPVSDESFDAILCTEVFEHIKNPMLALKEFSRILKRGGVLILTAPTASLTHMAPYHYCSGFDIYWYKVWTEECDLEIDSIQADGNYFEFVMHEMFRLPSTTKTYTGKELNIFYKGLAYIMGRKLFNLSKNSKGSEELLSIGYHVVAHKK